MVPRNTCCALFVLSFYLAQSVAVFAQRPEAIILCVDDVRGLVVEPLTQERLLFGQLGSGLAVWNEGGRDRWLDLENPDKGVAKMTDATSRGTSVDAGTAFVLPTRQLDQLLGQSVTRAKKGLLTPTAAGRHLSGKITFRRIPGKQDEELPQLTLRIFQSTQMVLETTLPSGKELVFWKDLPSLPEELKDGLSPGTYRIASVDARINAEFHVVDSLMRQNVLEHPRRMSKLLDSANQELCHLFEVEHLLSWRDEGSRHSPFLIDALDRLEATAPESRTLGQKNLIRQIRKRLGQEFAVQASEGDTGIEAIDQARALIARGAWDEALQLLSKVPTDSDQRTLGLTALYLAVLQAESATSDVVSATLNTEKLFQAAVTALQQAGPREAVKAHVNFGNYLVGRMQDRLHNHAARAAAGVQNPLMQALIEWQRAHDHYRTALAFAEESSVDMASLQVNLARMYVILADLLRTLTNHAHDSSTLQYTIQAANELAEVVRQNKENPPLMRAVAEELLAHLAYRGNQRTRFLKHIDAATNAYLAAGSLVGIESCLRTRGLFYDHLRQMGQGNPEQLASNVLNHLQAAQLWGELLRQRVEADQTGMSRAGFFARRSYVTQRIVEILIDQGLHCDALLVAERGKAQSLQDVLLGAQIDAGGADYWSLVKKEERLANWPTDVVALEYLFGDRFAWVFVVHQDGSVSAEQLKDGTGTPIATFDLIARVKDFTKGMQLQAVKMRGRLAKNQGLDHSWQDDLHRFYKLLIPPTAKAALAEAKQVVIVPHHILHYFPFAALVTKLDHTEPGPLEMPMPEYLIDAPVDIVYAPSLTAWQELRENSSRPLQAVNALGIAEFAKASPLPGVKRDLTNLRNRFGGQLRRERQNLDANKNALLSLLDRPGMLFLATHGTNLADRPLDSFLTLRKNQLTDDRLTAMEIYQSPVEADLVVMSACFSGLGDRSPMPGDDLFGLQRAFLHAGASCVVSGIWDVYDDTGPKLMNAFFAELTKGKKTPTALANAQRQFLETYRKIGAGHPWHHPYFWAVYTCIGSDQIRFIGPAN